jgi:SAM-dependent methyltransferase
MLRNEALAIEAIMPKMTFMSSGPRIANLGSQTLEFRRDHQPHVGYLFDAIQEAGLKVTHCDIQGGAGIDLQLDLMEPGSLLQHIHRFDIVMICNLLEHLDEPSLFIENLKLSMAHGTILLVSGPRDFPHHPDPIDNGFRPDLDELRALLSGFDLIHHEEVSENFFLESTILKRGAMVGYSLQLAMRALSVFPQFRNRGIGWFRPAKAFVSLWIISE